MKQVYPVTIESGMTQSGSCILMLHEPQGNMQIPIVIGRNEAQSIILAQNPSESARLKRPMTHQLMTTMMETYGLTLKLVTIDRVQEGVFFATLHVSDGFNESTLDSRTTDAVTLALLTGAPIFIDEAVLEATGMPLTDFRTAAPNPRPAATLEELELELRRCEQEENYERAAEIQAEIDKLTGK